MPHPTVEAVIDAAVSGDTATVRRLAPSLGPADVARLRLRHTTIDGQRAQPEFTIDTEEGVTVVTWIPLADPKNPAETLNVYSFDAFDLSGEQIVRHRTNAAPHLSYKHGRTQVAPRTSVTVEDRDAQTVEANLALMDGFYREVWDAQNPDAVDGFVAEGYVQHAEWRGANGREALRETAREIFSSPPPPMMPGMPPMGPPPGAGPVGPPPGAPAGPPAGGLMGPPAGPPAGMPPLKTVLRAAQGDFVARAAEVPFGGLAFDAYLVRDGLLAEHWSGVDPRTQPRS